MSEETNVNEKNYTILPTDKRQLSFVFTKGQFEGKRVNIKLPIDYIDGETKEELDLEFNYYKNIDKDDYEKAVGEVFLDIYGSAASLKARKYLEKMKAEKKKIKI